MLSFSDLWTALAAAQFAGSLAVTLHVLLRPRVPSSAPAWIGLAWFAPGIGALLYLVLGINRIERRGRRLRRRKVPAPAAAAISAIDPPHLIPLVRAGTLITGRQQLAGNAVLPLLHGDAAYPAMLAAIAAARSSIALSTYIFRHDGAGRAFIDALAAAQARGVAVRVLIDGIGGGYLFSPAWRALRRAGIPAARFLHTRLPHLNLRTHRKLLIVDGHTGFTGGVNIGDENLEPADPPPPRKTLRLLNRRRRGIRDIHFRLDGPVVAQMMAAFAEDWAFAAGETLHGALWFPPITPIGTALARVVTSGPDHDLERIKRLRMAAITAARTRIRIVTPYFLPDEALSTTLELAVLRGVRVDILVSERSDHRPLDWAMHDGLLALARAGCRIRWCAPPFNHTKLMTLDGAWASIGSANWDMRSLRLNFELDVELLDPATAAHLNTLIDAIPAHAAPHRDLATRSLPARLRDAATRLLLPYL